MVRFKLPGDPTPYQYPEGPQDVTIGAFLSYVQDVLPTEPEVFKTIAALRAEAAPIIRDIRDHVPGETYAPAAVLAEAEAYLAGRSTAKARKVLPALLQHLEVISRNLTIAYERADSPVTWTHQVLPYCARVVAHFTGAPLRRLLGEEDGIGMHPAQLEALYNRIRQAVETEPEETGETRFEFQGTTYVLPDNFMEKRATVIEFAEAAQFQARAQDLAGGEWEAALNVCAVLLRPEGKKYDAEAVESRRELFRDLPLSTVWQVLFFSLRQSAASVPGFQISILARTLAQLKREPASSWTVTAGT